MIEKLRAKIDIPISIDTSKAQVARAAIDAGAAIVNDVTGGRGDEGMLALIAETKAAFIIMHMQGTPRTMQNQPHYEDVVAEVADFFRQQYARAIECGIDPMAIAFDPGIGFGKTLEHNLELLAQLERLRVHDRPLVIGVSRKVVSGQTSRFAGDEGPPGACGGVDFAFARSRRGRVPGSRCQRKCGCLARD